MYIRTFYSYGLKKKFIGSNGASGQDLIGAIGRAYVEKIVNVWYVELCIGCSVTYCTSSKIIKFEYRL